MHLCFKFARSQSSVALVRNLSSAQLPRLPVPQLQDTLNKCLRSIRPLVTPEQLAQTETVFRQFGEPGGVGSQLQQLLIKRAEKHENWLADWWLNSAYLEYRSSVVVFSSPGLVMPRQHFESPEEQIMFAAKLVLAVLDFKSLIDNDKLQTEMMGKDPLDMAQYKKVFGTCRLPRIPRDEIVYHPDSRHIVVMHNNNIFQLNVISDDNAPCSQQQIYEALTVIVDMCDHNVAPVGVLTSDHRDVWSENYQLLVKDPSNAETLKSIESALFVLCLDDASGEEGVDDRTMCGLQTIHGNGVMSNGGNRWYDKTIQFLVSQEGRVGLTYEHSPAEGQPIASIVDHIMSYIESNKSAQVQGDHTTPTNLCVPLRFNVNKEIKQAIKTSASNLENLINNLEAQAFSFDKYGKDFIKSQKLSPDSFIQMAMQFAFYRLHNVPGAHYETASTRKYLHGRTETIRSCSQESVEFAQAMLDTATSPQQKVLALKKAVNAHKDYTIQALNGFGVDRHLLGLKLTALDHGLPVPALYSDPGYLKSLHMRISTSQVALKSDGFMIYGPLVEDGYGCCYNPRPNDIKFGTTAFVSCPETCAVEFCRSLEQSLTDMHQLLASTPTAHL
ncbi:carnitine O-acetyltransferase-like [Macrosteles quadrilineatus]|uniref:carnitine O-acetyltransferase-like n=1 Tax=Macrosteles quadrilineatus TaxID=74068 RepID=UPI0023E23A4D|nr:carnitine O-acetyltransferase-like [Macrosteles quadrilineatus]